MSLFKNKVTSYCIHHSLLIGRFTSSPFCDAYGKTHVGVKQLIYYEEDYRIISCFKKKGMPSRNDRKMCIFITKDYWRWLSSMRNSAWSGRRIVCSSGVVQAFERRMVSCARTRTESDWIRCRMMGEIPFKTVCIWWRYEERKRWRHEEIKRRANRVVTEGVDYGQERSNEGVKKREVAGACDECGIDCERGSEWNENDGSISGDRWLFSRSSDA